MNSAVKKIFRNPPVLYTQRLTLRKLEKSDYSDMFEYAGNKELTKFLTWEPHPDSAYTLKFLSYIQSKYRAGEFFDWAIVYNGKMVGTCGFTRIDEYNLCGEIGYVVSPAFQNCGIATEAVLEVMRFGFEALGLHRIEARYMIENCISRRVMEKAKMSFEGILRDSMFIKGHYVCVGVCSILRDEYFSK